MPIGLFAGLFTPELFTVVFLAVDIVEFGPVFFTAPDPTPLAFSIAVLDLAGGAVISFRSGAGKAFFAVVVVAGRAFFCPTPGFFVASEVLTDVFGVDVPAVETLRPEFP